MTTALAERPRPGHSPNSRWPRLGKHTNPGPQPGGDKRNDPPPTRPGKDNTPPPRPMPKPGR